jgi:hypothetical protein
MDVVEKFGTPLKISYLPRISQNIQKAKSWFRKLLRKPIIKRIIDIAIVQNPVILNLYWKKL